MRLIIHSNSKQLKIINAESLVFIQEKYLFSRKENVLRRIHQIKFPILQNFVRVYNTI